MLPIGDASIPDHLRVKSLPVSYRLAFSQQASSRPAHQQLSATLVHPNTTDSPPTTHLQYI